MIYASDPLQRHSEGVDFLDAKSIYPGGVSRGGELFPLNVPTIHVIDY